MNKKIINIYSQKFPYLVLCRTPQLRIESLHWKMNNISIFNAFKAYHWLETVKRMQSKKGCKDQRSIQSSTTLDPGYQWESDKLAVRHHT